MNDDQLIFAYSKKYRNIYFIFGGLIYIVLIIALIKSISLGNIDFVALLLLPAIVLLTIGLIYVSKVKIILSEKFIEKSLFKKEHYY